QLDGLSDAWLFENEGPDTWSPFDIVGHLIHGEKTDWIPRMRIILSDGPDKTFTPFDRFAQFEASKGKTLRQLLGEFRDLRAANLNILRATPIGPDELAKTGIHPAFGPVTLEQLLATWTVHDLGHIAQVSRVLAKQYRSAVGPWEAYLPVLTR
ncbi:MAG: DinB family protein, partial [Saprospiraceae bacterium]|nr:DinB family protein [Saprospiraceae bacterium]